MKHSMYSMVIPIGRDGVLMYNSPSGALAKLTSEEYQKYLELSFGEADNELVENLKRGMFIVPEDSNELEKKGGGTLWEEVWQLTSRTLKRPTDAFGLSKG